MLPRGGTDLPGAPSRSAVHAYHARTPSFRLPSGSSTWSSSACSWSSSACACALRRRSSSTCSAVGPVCSIEAVPRWIIAFQPLAVRVGPSSFQPSECSAASSLGRVLTASPPSAPARRRASARRRSRCGSYCGLQRSHLRGCTLVQMVQLARPIGCHHEVAAKDSFLTRHACICDSTRGRSEGVSATSDQIVFWTDTH